MSLFNIGSFTLSSGATSNFKIDCDFLTDNDLATLAWLIAERLKCDFAKAVAVPQGGVRLATLLYPHTTVLSENILLVDDVLTTGASMERAREKLFDRGHLNTHIIGTVIFARGPCPYWITPLFTLTTLSP